MFAQNAKVPVKVAMHCIFGDDVRMGSTPILPIRIFITIDSETDMGSDPLRIRYSLYHEVIFTQMGTDLHL